MLTELYIRNYLFVAEQRIRFGSGMTVITGETGAGKSILVGSIALIFGDKGDPEALDKAQPIYLEASFDTAQNGDLHSFLSREGYEIPEELILAREISPAGKSQYFVNGRKVAVSFIKELKPILIDFHHQRDQQKLLNPGYQLELLDSYALLQPLRESFGTKYDMLHRDIRSLGELRRKEEENLRLRELYQYQFDELDKAHLKDEEDISLQKEFEMLTHSLEISELSGSGAFELTEAESSLYDRIRGIVNSLDRFSGIDAKLANALSILGEALESIREASAELSDISESIASDPGRLEAVQSRLDMINGLLFKHRVTTISQLLKLFEERQQQLDAMEDSSRRIGELETSISQDYDALLRLGEELHEQRQKAAQQLRAELENEVRELAIPKAVLEIQIDKKAANEKSMLKYLSEIDETGLDSINILFSANPGYAAKALSAVASGGELSRVLLAVKKVLAKRMPARLVILDEIDAGIGGKTAEQVAVFIRQLAGQHRVMCITHLAQIAAIAEHHLAITKVVSASKTKIEINELAEARQHEEIARMLSGNVTELSLLHARELLNRYKEVVHE